MANIPKLYVVSHTHWDRAWYQSFASYRIRLVELIDDLLQILRADATFPSFMLDGQTVILEDYLAVRPEREEEIRQHVSSGRIAIGPWYTSPDLFLAGGESVIRNLQLGLEMAQGFGGSMEVGYVADPFGHFAQMPQILKNFGIKSYVFMRGMPNGWHKEFGSLFRWRSHDGSELTAVYLATGYFAAGALGFPSPFGRYDGGNPDMAMARERVTQTLETLRRGYPGGPWLMLNGCDHMPVQSNIGEVLEGLRPEFPEIEIEHGDLSSYVRDVLSSSERRSLPTHLGDLLGNDEHPILQSVYSARSYLKQQNHAAISLVTRYVEPFLAWQANIPPAGRYDGSTLLAQIWKSLLKNHPHDDICGCSVDTVHREDEVRFAEVEDGANAMLFKALEIFPKSGFNGSCKDLTGTCDQYLWFQNPHPWPLRQRVDVEVFFPGEEGKDRSPLAQMIYIRRGWNEPEIVHSIESIRDRATFSAYLETSHGTKVSCAMDVNVPATGYAIYRCRLPSQQELNSILLDQGVAEDLGQGGAIPRPRIVVDYDRQSVSLEHPLLEADISQWLQFQIEGDTGDTYSFSPDLSFPMQVAKLRDWRRGQDASGEWYLDLVHEVCLEHFPGDSASESASATRRQRPERLEIFTHITPWGDGAVALDIQYLNTITDARLRVVVSTLKNPSSVLVDHPFRLASVPWPPAPQEFHGEECVKPSYPGEYPYATMYQGDFAMVPKGNLHCWIANRGANELQILASKNGSCELAITLHRSVGMLSVASGRIRSCQAGPSIPTPEAQSLRQHRHFLAFGVNVGAEEALREAKSFSHPLHAVQLPRLAHWRGTEATLPAIASQFQLNNSWVQVSANYRKGAEGPLVLRMVNLSETDQRTIVKFFSENLVWQECDFLEHWKKHKIQWANSGEFELLFRPNEIKTILVRDSAELDG